MITGLSVIRHDQMLAVNVKLFWFLFCLFLVSQFVRFLVFSLLVSCVFLVNQFRIESSGVFFFWVSACVVYLRSQCHRLLSLTSPNTLRQQSSIE